MNLVRKSFSKHYCPSCEARVFRDKPQQPGAVLEDLILYVPYLVVWLVCAAIVVQFGGDRLAAGGLSAVVTVLLLNPIFFKYSEFHCRACGRRSTHQEVTCRGFGWVV